jgi:uncharacterized membrane protein (UPF0127 family)
VRRGTHGFCDDAGVRHFAALACLTLLVAACGGDGDSAGPTTTVADPGPAQTTTRAETETAAPPTTTEEEGDGPVVLIQTERGEEVEVQAEIADTQGERELGLMHREFLPDDAGMIFLFDEEVTGGFWMKNTLIPLSIAFADGDGTILRILDMEPCEADPCEIYDPGVSYASALEVNRGAFESWGVAEGDLLTLEQ